MRRTHAQFSRTVIILSAVTFSMGTMQIMIGVMFRYYPDKVAQVRITEEVKQNIKVCAYKGLNVCQAFEDLTNFNFAYIPRLKKFSEYFFLMGFTKVLYSVFGVFGAICKSSHLLIIMMFIMFQSVALECIYMDILINPLHEFHKSINEEMSASFSKVYNITGRKENSYTLGWNLIMMNTKCCGARNWTDVASDYTVTDNEGVSHTFQYPPACCDFTLRPKGPGGVLATEEENFHFLKNCAEVKRRQPGITEGRIFPVGCFFRLHTHGYEKMGATALSITLIFIFVQTLQVIYVIMTVLTIPSTDGTSSNTFLNSSALVMMSGTETTSKQKDSKNDSGKRGNTPVPSSPQAIHREMSTTVW